MLCLYWSTCAPPIAIFKWKWQTMKSWACKEGSYRWIYNTRLHNHTITFMWFTIRYTVNSKCKPFQWNSSHFQMACVKTNNHVYNSIFSYDDDTFFQIQNSAVTMPMHTAHTASTKQPFTKDQPFARFQLVNASNSFVATE